MEAPSPRRLRVLMSAFACEPYKGSEPEVGWQWAVQMARFHDVTVLTQSKNRQNIDRALAELRKKQSVPQFIYFDREPYLQRLRRRRAGLQLYCMLWHKAARKLVAHLHQATPFDLMHHVTLAGFRYPTAIWGHGAHTIWGPVGGIENSPIQLLPWRYPRAVLPELARNFHNTIQNWPFTTLRYRLAAKTITLASTREMQLLTARLGHPAKVMPTIGLRPSEIPFQPKTLSKGPLKLLFVGNIIALKGVLLAVQALAQSGTNATLTLIGTGNLQGPMTRLATRLGVRDRLDFRGRLAREQVIAAYPEFDVLLFPSFHDTGGYAVIEAMCQGLPVICLDCGGPAIAVESNCGVKVPISARQEVITGLAEAIRTYDADKQLLLEHSRNARQRVLDYYDWDRKGEQLAKVYAEAAAAPAAKAFERGFGFVGRMTDIIHRLTSMKGVVATLMLMLAISMLGFSSVSLLKKRARQIVTDTVPGLSFAGEAGFSLSQGFNRTLLMVLARDKEQRLQYAREIDIFAERTTRALRDYETAIYEPSDRALFNELTGYRAKYTEVRNAVVSLLQQEHQAEAEELCRTQLLPAYDRYRAAGEALLHYNVDEGHKEGQSILAMSSATQIMVAVVGIFLFIAGFFIGFFK